MLTLYIADAERDVGMKNLSQKEAIALLRNLEDSLDSYCELDKEGKTAFRMAIEALSCSEIPNNSDTISRQAALETIRTMQTYKLFAGDDMILIDKAQVQTELMMLPSVQPETNCSEIPNNWIPCSEKLPDKEGDYLVTLLDDRGTWVEIALWNETFGGRWQAVLYNDVDYSDISNAIAWLPLPEPYQGGGQDG